MEINYFVHWCTENDRKFVALRRWWRFKNNNFVSMKELKKSEEKQNRFILDDNSWTQKLLAFNKSCRKN